MYEPGTILVKNEPLSTEDEPFAYDRIEVIGPSPINHSDISSEWTGASGSGVLIRPAGDGFGSNLDEPFGKLQSLYTVESIPEQVIRQPEVRVITPALAGPSPEEVFAKAAADGGTKAERRPPRSPLDVPTGIEARTDETELNAPAEDAEDVA